MTEPGGNQHQLLVHFFFFLSGASFVIKTKEIIGMAAGGTESGFYFNKILCSFAQISEKSVVSVEVLSLLSLLLLVIVREYEKNK